MLEVSRRGKTRQDSATRSRPLGVDVFDQHQPIGKIRERAGEIVVVPAAGPDEEPQQHGPIVRAAGRIMLRRKAGKLYFLNLLDWTGKVQVLVGKSQVGEENWALAECFDLGDLVGVDGELKHTKTGELTIFAQKLHFLGKSIETPPEKFKGLTDPELRQRMRYLDLIHTDGVLERFLRRTRIVQSIRSTLAGESFVEIEGPTLHAIAGGAGRPTVQNASQRPGHSALPANRPGTASEAAPGRRHGAGL